MCLRLLTLLLLIWGPQAMTFAQAQLGGNIYLSTDDTPLPGASVINRSSGLSTLATPAGTYSIEAKAGDVIIFSFAGMITDTVMVEDQLLKTGYDIGLIENTRALKTVTVTSSYQQDSLRRRKEYAAYFERGAGITGRNRPGEGFGVSVSPVSHFSKKAREQRKLRKKLMTNEREAYIDYVFFPGWVSKLTGLKADSLQQFMYRYRPTYKIARTLDRPGMIAYIHNRYKDFMRKAN